MDRRDFARMLRQRRHFVKLASVSTPSDPAKALEFLATENIPALGPGPRAGVRPLGELQRELDTVLTQEANDELRRALILLWHDHLDAAHAIAQDHETPDGSYIHALMHRREPDYSNAKYWFRRVPDHPAYPRLAARAERILEDQGAAKRWPHLIRNGRWDSLAFVDACAAAAKHPTDAAPLEMIQVEEFKVLLEYLGENSPRPTPES